MLMEVIMAAFIAAGIFIASLLIAYSKQKQSTPSKIIAQSKCLGRKIMVVGPSGSGKSTFSSSLSLALQIPYIQLDAVHWQDNWGSLSKPDFLNAVVELLENKYKDTWVVDGSYSAVRDYILDHADTLIYLDYPLYITLFRCVRRTLTRIWTREELWGRKGTKESFTKMLSSDSIVIWSWWSIKKLRKLVPEIIQRDNMKGKKIFWFKDPAEAEALLKEIAISHIK